MNILVTSGGTTENIDAVRSITNISSGKLGSIIAERFAEESRVEKIFYICGKNSLKPQNGKTEVLYVASVSSLENAVREVIGKAKIDIIIHCMAVSDYRVKLATSAAKLAPIVEKSESVIQGDGKISSDVDDLILLMERTPKIISLFRTLTPESTLVGFKLLDKVPHETLIEKGFQILTQNKCSFVLANDLSDIKEGQHIGYLMDRERNYTRYETKAEIAKAIVSATMRERGF